MTFRPYYELHVTMIGEPEYIKQHIGDWHFSKIDGDPNLGPGVKCYATLHVRKESCTENMAKLLVNNKGDFLTRNGIDVLRTKVELVIYDSKAEVDVIIS